MLSQELRQKLMTILRKDPKEAVRAIEAEPQILDILLRSDEQVENERNEKIKYINMTNQMQQRLEEEAKKLKTTQGLLIGAGVLFFLSLLEDSS